MPLTTAMKMSESNYDLVCDEREIYERLLPLRNSDILELGCGKAEKTFTIAECGKVNRIVALEVDEIQHAKNLQRNPPANVSFQLGGAQAIPADDRFFDIVLMFKSLHHVPLTLMDAAMAEIHRVLKPGGVAYISEPVFAGEFNEILRLFHDEQAVRAAAFAAVERAVAAGSFELVSETFFDAPVHFENFEQFEEQILKVTHTQHRLPPGLYSQVRQKFMHHMKPDGANFRTPIRVDLLRKV